MLSIRQSMLILLKSIHRATKRDIYKILKPLIFDEQNMKIFKKTMLLLLLSKTLTLCSPFCLKIAVNALADVHHVNFSLACLGIGAFGLTRIFSTLFQELRMNQIQEIMQRGILTMSEKSFEHLHSLDLYFHKISSKNIVFAVNKAIRSIESAMRFTLGFFTPVVFEFIMICCMLQFYCGPYYLGKKYSTYR